MVGAFTIERRLCERLNGIRSRGSGWYAVLVKLSHVRAVELTPPVAALVLNPLRGLAGNHDVEVYALANRDVVAICRKVPVAIVRRAVGETCALLSDDPVASRRAHPPNGAFVTWYDLADDSHFESLMSDFEDPEAGDVSDVCSGTGGSVTPAAPRALSTADLHEIQKRLEELPIADLIRQQIAFEAHPGVRARPVFREAFVSITALRERLGLEANPGENPWLFHCLTEMLDRRMLDVVEAGGLREPRIPLSLNVKLRTLSSLEFEQFRDTLGKFCERLICEIQFTDVIANLVAYVTARDVLRAEGCRVAIDGVDPQALPFVDLAVLDPDLLKLWWVDGVPARSDEGRLEAMQVSIDALGADRVVLARVDSQEGVKWGLKLGIRRFQGHFIDSVIGAEERRQSSLPQCQFGI